MSCTVPLPGAVVCGWWTCVCAVRVVGYPLRAPPPRRGGGWGHRGWWGAVVDGGWHGE